MEDIRKKEYAAFMEDSLKAMVELPVEGICIVTKLKGGSVFTNFHNVSVLDKLTFAGVIQQDAMLETMRINGYIKKQESEEETEE